MNYFVTQLCNSFSTDSNFWSGIIGALVGSATGGAIAYIMQALSLKEARKTRKNDLLLAQQTLATALLFKITSVHNDFASINSHMKDCAAQLHNPTDEPWQTIRPFPNFPAPVHFTSEEQTMLFWLKDDDAFRAVNGLGVSFNGLGDIAKALSRERRELSDVLYPEKVEGQIIYGNFDESTYLRLRPKIIGINQLIDSITKESDRLEKEALQVLEKLAVLFKRHLNLSLKSELKNKST